MVMHHHPDVRESPWANSRGRLFRTVGRIGLALFAGGLFAVLAWEPRLPSAVREPGDERVIQTDAVQGVEVEARFDGLRAPFLDSDLVDETAMNSARRYSTAESSSNAREQQEAGQVRFTAAGEAHVDSNLIENSRGPP